MPTRDTVRIAAVSDMHYGKQSQGMLQIAVQPDRRAGGHPHHAGRPHRLRTRGGGARARSRPDGVREDPDRGRARKPRFRVGRVRGDRAHPHRRGRARARRGFRRDPGSRVRRREGIRRRVRARHAGPVGRARDQGVRPGSGERGAQARVGARAAEDAASHRDRALRADRGDGRGRARRDLPVARVEPTGRAAHALPGERRGARTRAQRRAGREGRRRAFPCTTSRSRCCARAIPTSRRSASSRCPARPSSPARSRIGVRATGARATANLPRAESPTRQGGEGQPADRGTGDISSSRCRANECRTRSLASAGER